MVSAIAGRAGGIGATISMTLVMMVMGDGGPPPTASLVAKFAGGAPDDHAMSGMVLHLFYGSVAGAVFAVGVSFAGVSLDSLIVATGLGLVYGLFLMVGGVLFWMRVLIGQTPDRDVMMTFATAHVVYGVVLGAFLGSGLFA